MSIKKAILILTKFKMLFIKGEKTSSKNYGDLFEMEKDMKKPFFIINFLSIFSLLILALSCGDDATDDNVEPGLIRTFTGHSDYVNSVVFSPDGQYALSGSSDGTLKYFNLTDGKCLRTFIGHTEAVNSVAISPDGLYALSGGKDGLIKYWRISDGICIKSVTSHRDYVNSVCFSPDGEYALSGGCEYDEYYENSIKYWDLPDFKRKGSGSSNEVENSVCFSSDGKFFLSGGSDAVVYWRTKDFSSWSFDYDRNITSVDLSSDGKYGLSANLRNTYIRYLKMEDLSCIRILDYHTDYVRSIVFSPDDKFALSGSSDKTLKYFRLSDGVCLFTLKGHDAEVNSVVISPDGKYALSGSADYTIKYWRIK